MVGSVIHNYDAGVFAILKKVCSELEDRVGSISYEEMNQQRKKEMLLMMELFKPSNFHINNPFVLPEIPDNGKAIYDKKERKKK